MSRAKKPVISAKRPSSVGCWKGVMFVDDGPLAVAFPEPHGEPEFQIGPLAVLDGTAVPYGCCKSHVVASGNLDLLKVKADRPRLRRKEKLPGCHVGIQSAR